MPHYLIQASYTADGAQGLLAEGGTSRVAEATGLIEALGGTVECLYFVWGTDDIIGITEMAATSLAVSASGKVGVRMTPLLSPGEIDAAAEKAGELSYRPPGG